MYAVHLMIWIAETYGSLSGIQGTRAPAALAQRWLYRGLGAGILVEKLVIQENAGSMAMRLPFFADLVKYLHCSVLAAR